MTLSFSSGSSEFTGCGIADSPQLRLSVMVHVHCLLYALCPVILQCPLNEKALN